MHDGKGIGRAPDPLMSHSRLNIALENGALTLPEDGAIAVFRPRCGFDLSAIARDRLQIVQGFKPDHDAFAAQGYDVATDASPGYAAAIICLPRSKVEARALIAQACCETEGPIVIDGQKTDGVESFLRDIRKRADVGEVTSKAHGKLFAFTGGDFPDWQGESKTLDGGFTTVPGVFSADAIDAGSAALVAALPKKLPKRIADLGAGWGYLSKAILANEKVAELHLVEAEHAALDCARKNITDPRAQFHWADATQFRPDAPIDAVIMNPPFHNSRAAEPQIGRAFIAAAANMLKPNGYLWFVANRHLPYEAEAAAHFINVEEIAGNKSFKVIAASKPRRKRG